MDGWMDGWVHVPERLRPSICAFLSSVSSARFCQISSLPTVIHHTFSIVLYVPYGAVHSNTAVYGEIEIATKYEPSSLGARLTRPCGLSGAPT